jgi:hypothetical protein
LRALVFGGFAHRDLFSPIPSNLLSASRRAVKQQVQQHQQFLYKTAAAARCIPEVQPSNRANLPPETYDS